MTSRSDPDKYFTRFDGAWTPGSSLSVEAGRFLKPRVHGGECGESTTELRDQRVLDSRRAAHQPGGRGQHVGIIGGKPRRVRKSTTLDRTDHPPETYYVWVIADDFIARSTNQKSNTTKRSAALGLLHSQARHRRPTASATPSPAGGPIRSDPDQHLAGLDHRRARAARCQSTGRS